MMISGPSDVIPRWVRNAIANHRDLNHGGATWGQPGRGGAFDLPNKSNEHSDVGRALQANGLTRSQARPRARH